MDGWDWVGRPDVGKVGNEHLAKIATDNLCQKNHQSAIKISKTALGCFQNTFCDNQLFCSNPKKFSVAHSLAHQLTD